MGQVIGAVRNDHWDKRKLKLRSQWSQTSSINPDMEALFGQYLVELQSVYREVEILTKQYSKKCLENAHLVQELEAEREARRQIKPVNQELSASKPDTEAMNNGQQEEMECMLEKSQRTQISSISSDMEALFGQYLEELQSVYRELEVLKEQYSQKCLENAHLVQQLEAEREARRQIKPVNQELSTSKPANETGKNSHWEEMERKLEKSQHSQTGSINSDVEALFGKYLEELQSAQRELEVLTEQYLQKCLENARLTQALNAEQQAREQSQHEKQELNASKPATEAYQNERERELEKSQQSQTGSINSDWEALMQEYLEELQSAQQELEVLKEQYSLKCLENAHLAQTLKAEQQAQGQSQHENQELNASKRAIEAVNNSHQKEMEHELEKSQCSQTSNINPDKEALLQQYLAELQLLHQELEELTEKYLQKCLENAQLTQALEADWLALSQCQCENEELNVHNQELHDRLTAEIDRLQTVLTGDAGREAAGSPLTQGKDAYELEDKKCPSDKYKAIYTEHRTVRTEPNCDMSQLKEQLKTLGEKSLESTTPVSQYDNVKSKSNPEFLKKNRSHGRRQFRNVRSKDLKEELAMQECLKFFEPRDLKKV